ncbi:MAG: DNA alkylation repair protein [Melioribacteraceae bacterium]|nr:DNA alkylation repair protein [Melioribacteraceae bacterium]MCF8265035.1 DNA alkylation repair protein [Melioribacteraceae bacterium]MCF8431649.1 DNA alkylation repair protein [Melioribacteraceae bacterium]
MSLEETLNELASYGTDQNKKVYGKHGVKDEMFGVSYANLGKIVKKIKSNHELGKQLWQTGIHDAKVLATMIIDSDQIKSNELDSMVKELGNYVITDAFSGVAAKSKFAIEKFKKWSKSKDEWISTAAYNILCTIAMKSDVDDSFFEEQIRIIQEKIHLAPNRTRYSMNNALITIGGSREKLHQIAVSAATQIGKVEVDHGETGCKTPDAIPYMERMRKRKRK